MNSDRDPRCRVGCPIRTPRDHRSLASPPGFSQRATSFIASQCQGIHQMPFFVLVRRSLPQKRPHHHRAQGQTPFPQTCPRASGGWGRSPAQAGTHRRRSRMKTLFEQTPSHRRGPVRLGHIINALFTLQSTLTPRPPAPRSRTSPNAASDPADRRWCLSAQLCCACRPAKPRLRRWWR
jgi:hypothetical protein